MRIFVAIAVLTVAGCPKPHRSLLAMEKMREFRDKMCLCKDKACADKVQDEMIRWSSEMAKSAGERDERLDDQQMKEMTEVGTQYGECMVKVMGGETTLPPPPAGENMPRSADAIIKQTFDQLGTTASITELQFSYVRADGVIDPTYGTAEIHFGKPKRNKAADDPDRPIGAPVPVDPKEVDDMMARCPVHAWKAGMRTEGEGSCMSFGELARPRCSVVEVWKQAIEAGAPAKGLAVLALGRSPGDGEPQSWTFAIDDDPRDIHFSKSVPDVCDPTLEKPVPMPPAPGTVQVRPNPY
jgi:hypothetical protein